MTLEERVRVRMENSYVEYISKCERGACLGEAIKMELGTFGQKELDAHKKAHELLGMHRAFAEVLKMIHEENIKKGGRN